MTSFAKASFDVAGYLACRPTYPPRLFDAICKYHALNGGRFERALDVGCGPGFVALALAPQFRNVKAIDPAKKMVDIGLQPKDASLPRIDYGVGSAEDLGAAGIGQGRDGVDLVVAGQAAHWFDYPKVWREFSKSVRPGGTVAFIGYAEMVFPRLPHLSRLIAHHSRSPEALGHYWQPGRRIVEAHLDPVPFPVTPSPSQSIVDQLPPLEATFAHPKISSIAEKELPNQGDDFDFSAWDPATAIRLRADVTAEGKEEEWLMKKTFTKSQLEGYFRTWSALHSYHEEHPDDLAKKGKEGDIVDRVVKEIWAGVGEDTKEIEAGWPLILMMIKKKGEQ